MATSRTLRPGAERKYATRSHHSILGRNMAKTSQSNSIRQSFLGFGGPGRDRTDDLFHAMEARSQLRHRPTSRNNRVVWGIKAIQFSPTSY
jgi:hypothetical protein